MNIWNKVFLGVIFATAIAVVLLAALEMRIRSTGLKHIANLKQKIADADGKIDKIRAGTSPIKISTEKSLAELSLEELRGRLRERYDERGRVWSGCIVAAMEQKVLGQAPGLPQIVAKITITGPFTQEAADGETSVASPDLLRGVVYIFAEDAEQTTSTFLGRFNVDSEPAPTRYRDSEGNEHSGFQVTLVTADPINDAETDRIFDAGNSPWTICMSPPVDRIAGIFDQLTEEEKEMIPAALRERFQPRRMLELTEDETEEADPAAVRLLEQYRESFDDPEHEEAQGFAALLDWLYLRRSSILRDSRVTEKDIETYQEAGEKAGVENVQLTADCEMEDKRYSAMEVQREAVQALLEQYLTEVNKLTLQIEKRQMLNEVYVAKIAEYLAMAAAHLEKQAEKTAQTEGEKE